MNFISPLLSRVSHRWLWTFSRMTRSQLRLLRQVCSTWITFLPNHHPTKPQTFRNKTFSVRWQLSLFPWLLNNSSRRSSSNRCLLNKIRAVVSNLCRALLVSRLIMIVVIVVVIVFTGMNSIPMTQPQTMTSSQPNLFSTNQSLFDSSM